jgi:hypothetical protein
LVRRAAAATAFLLQAARDAQVFREIYKTTLASKARHFSSRRLQADEKHSLSTTTSRVRGTHANPHPCPPAKRARELTFADKINEATSRAGF